MSLLGNIIGLDKLGPEFQAIVTQILDREDAMLKEFEAREAALLVQVNGIIQGAMDRFDGAELVSVVTLKLPQAGSKMAGVVEGKQ